MQNLDNKQKKRFSGKGRKTLKLSKSFLLILEFPINLFQIWLTNTKPFFWESEANLETLQKLSARIGVTYKFVLKSVESLNRLKLKNIGSRFYNAKFGRRIQNHFSRRAKQTLILSKIILPILEFL